MDNDNEYQFVCKNGDNVKILIDDEQLTAVVTTETDEDVGRFEFVQYDGENFLRLAWAYLDRHSSDYKHQGIGRECLRIMIDRFNMPIGVAAHDGIKRDDGSHLTGDAPAFVAKMVEEGLVFYVGGSPADDEMRDDLSDQ